MCLLHTNGFIYFFALKTFMLFDAYNEYYPVFIEVEFLNRPSGTMAMMSAPVMMVPPDSGAAGSSIQRLLTSMTQTTLNIRRFYNINTPLPPMEEPCPCDADCCSRPMEPRRLLPVLNLPMTMHQGCCGCVDCPVSLSPMVASVVQRSNMMSMMSQAGPATEPEGK